MILFRKQKGYGNFLLRVSFLFGTVVSLFRLRQFVPVVPLEDGRIDLPPSSASPRLQFIQSCDNDSCPLLPQWMKTYFQWHTQQVQRISANPHSQWQQQRLLVVRCLEGDRCGGTADRLKSLPLYLALAAKTKRLLFLRWTRPFRLESFMVPGEVFNWTVPDTLLPFLVDPNNITNKVFFGGKAVVPLVRAAHQSNMWLVEGAAQMAAADLFLKIASELDDRTTPAPVTFFHEMFLALFRPVPALQQLVEQQMEALDLYPNQFVTAHIRAKYPGEPYRETWNLTLLQRTVTNAIDCASSLAHSSLPIYVASDTLVSLQAAHEYPTQVRVVSHLDAKTLPQQDPPHLNFAKENDPSAFFSIFADLFIMSQSRCVAFGAGGFGRFGSLVSFNASCRVTHSIQGQLYNCSNI